MIRINKGESKEVIFTLKEKGSLSNPYYIFELNSNDNRNNTLFTTTDISTNTDRYNAFTFSEGTTATFSAGFDLEVGTYDYTVYETGITQSIDITGATAVEIGLLEIVGTVSNYTTYDDSDDDREYTFEPS